jgi:hypothetical protein
MTPCCSCATGVSCRCRAPLDLRVSRAPPPPLHTPPPLPPSHLTPRRSPEQQASNNLQWFAQDMAARASSCASQPLHLDALSSRSGDDERVQMCSAGGDCTPTLLLLLHSWSSSMQQLWFEADLSPLLSLPPDVNLVFATSLNAADVVSASMLHRLSSLQRSGGILQWLLYLLGMASPSPIAHVIQPQLSQQHRAVQPFMCVRPAPRPPPPPFTTNATHFLQIRRNERIPRAGQRHTGHCWPGFCGGGGGR